MKNIFVSQDFIPSDKYEFVTSLDDNEMLPGIK
jgi:hypothetical protein